MSTSSSPISVQVQEEHYQFSRYLTLPRWLSYWQQISTVLECRPENVLYVGVGDGFVPDILRKQGVQVDTFDFDSRLRPDFTGSVHALTETVPQDRYDVIVCCQVLEHLPYEFFSESVRELLASTRRRVVLSLPYSHWNLLRLNVKIPLASSIYLNVKLPKLWKTWKFDGEHHWEVGVRGYSKSRIASDLGAIGKVTRAFHVKQNEYHLFYILEKFQ